MRAANIIDPNEYTRATALTLQRKEMELVTPVTAGTEVVLETTLEAVTPKQTRAGTCVFVTTLHTFRDR
ncbi:hypothetical protein [Streptomyces diastatochromogenes]|uniref:hypothetical protein n=1 Tax=Streptomyces diastatochromogenes TaxID=42236 RepID=UPI0036AA91FF